MLVSHTHKVIKTCQKPPAVMNCYEARLFYPRELNIAIENDQFIVHLPIQNCGFPVRYVNVFQRVCCSPRDFME